MSPTDTDCVLRKVQQQMTLRSFMELLAAAGGETNFPPNLKRIVEECAVEPEALNRQKAAPPASADDAQAAPSPAKAPDVAAALALLHARRLRCTVGPGAQADWTSGKPVVELVEWREGSEMDFDAIDLGNGTARGLTTTGSSDETVLATSSGLTFIEQTESGNLDITTVFARLVGDEYPVVESRHLAFPAGLRPSQYHGTCRVLPSH